MEHVAFTAMQELEAGAIANPDEERQVGHYWLRDPQLAPSDEVRTSISIKSTPIANTLRKVANVFSGASIELPRCAEILRLGSMEFWAEISPKTTIEKMSTKMQGNVFDIRLKIGFFTFTDNVFRGT